MNISTKNPLISVIIPVYNVEEYLSECIASVLGQSYSNLEILLINDGSTDRSAFICEKYALQDSRILLIDKENGGLSSARNTGLDSCRGEFITFLDSDDVLHAQFIERLYHELVANNADLAFSSLQRFDSETPDLYKIAQAPQIVFEKNQIFDEFYNHSYTPNIVIACAKLYRRFIFDDLRFPLGKLHEDEFLIHHIYSKCERVVWVQQPLYYYRVREGSIMSLVSKKKLCSFIAAMENRISFSKQNNLLKFKNATENNLMHYLINNFKRTNYSMSIRARIWKKNKSLLKFMMMDYSFTLKEKIYLLYKLLYK